MKFVALEHEKFELPYLSFMLAVVSFVVNFWIEVVNIWNLTYIGEIFDLILNYVALGCIFEFDEYFVEMYKQQNFMKFIEGANNGENKVLSRKKFTKSKIKVSYVEKQEQKQGIIPFWAYAQQEKLNYNIGDNLD
jgi:hypothetical protein